MKFIYVCIYDPEVGSQGKMEVHVYTSVSLAKDFLASRIDDIECRSDQAKLRFRILVGWSYKNPEDGSLPRLRGIACYGYRLNDNNEIVSYIEGCRCYE